MANIVTPRFFEQQLKRLSKKFPSLKNEFRGLIESIQANPTQGVFIGRNCYKIRLSIASKGRGKSGGGRVITCFQVVEDTVYLLAIYDKSEQEYISDDALDKILKALGLEENP